MLSFRRNNLVVPLLPEQVLTMVQCLHLATEKYFKLETVFSQMGEYIAHLGNLGGTRCCSEPPVGRERVIHCLGEAVILGLQSKHKALWSLYEMEI